VALDEIALTPFSTETLSILSGSVIFPNFRINTNRGIISLSGGSYDANTKTLTITSWILMVAGSGVSITSGTIMFTPESQLISDTISPDEIVNTYENFLFWEMRFSPDTRDMMKEFISKDASGSLVPIAPTNTAYFNKYIRGLLSIMLAQPEYVLLTGYDIPTSTEIWETTFLDSITGKLFIIELYGGNDSLTSIIPKDEYDIYRDYRTNSSGSIAITGTGLVDIGDFYMNSALAYSTGTTGFKDLYDQGYLKIFNRVGGYRHSSDHDAAAKQISSYDSTTSSFAEWVFGHLVQKERESSHTISLGARLPNVYRAGHYVNLGWNIILTNPLDSGNQWKSHMDTMVNLSLTRSYPANTKNLFRDAGRISEIGKTSVAQGWAPGASGNMSSVFNFARVLLDNNIGRTFYMGGAGGYDTHDNQFNGLNNNLKTVSASVTSFFNQVKDTQDVTIIIFSEFGRTNKTNGGLGTDHGDGGGMYVITSNRDLRNTLQAGTYGNQSIKYAKNNSLGVGVDYRSVYGSIFQALYKLNPITYFGQNINLFRDISLEKNTVSLLSYSYQASWQNVTMGVELTVSGSNFNPGKAGYTRLLTHTGDISTPKITRLSEKSTPEGYRYTFSINQNTQPFYTVESFSNQYALTTLSGSLTGATRPLIIPNTSRNISQEKSSILTLFGNVSAPSMLAWSGIVIEGTGGVILPLPENPLIKLHFDSWATRVTELTYVSGSTTWRWGFILGENIDKAFFLPHTALLTFENRTLPHQNIVRLMKLGADQRWVGMKLNQSIGLEFSGLIPGDEYRVISSEDGIRWMDVESDGMKYAVNASGSLQANIDHFSYFALLSTANIVDILPTCTIVASPRNVLNGSSTLLTWSLQNVQTGTLNPGNILLWNSGTTLITPPSSTTTSYSITVSNMAGSTSCAVDVIASAVPPPPPPICTLSSNPSSVLNGSGTILSWNIANANTWVINPWNIPVAKTGTQMIIPPSNASTQYVLSVTNTGWSSTCATVITTSSTPPPISPPTCTIWANPATIINGARTLLTWSIQNAATGILNPGGAIVWANESITITPPSNTITTYGITVSNSSGSGSCTTQVHSVVSENQPPIVSVGPGGGWGYTPPQMNTPVPKPEIKIEDTVPNSVRWVSWNVRSKTKAFLEYSESHPDESSLSRSTRLSIDIWEDILDYPGDKERYKTRILQYLVWEKIGRWIHTQSAINKVMYYVRMLEIPEASDAQNVSYDTFSFGVISQNPVYPEGSNAYADNERSSLDSEDIFIPAQGERYIAVENSVNLRTTPILSDLNIMRTLSRNTKVELLGTEGEWALIKTEGIEWYVKSVFLREGTIEDDIRYGKMDASSGEKALVIAERSLFVREGPTTLSGIKWVLYSGDQVTILDRIGKWVEIASDTYRWFVVWRYLR
jgi:uncharacterized protein YgiM (DUF1202 family)